MKYNLPTTKCTQFKGQLESSQNIHRARPEPLAFPADVLLPSQGQCVRRAHPACDLSSISVPMARAECSSPWASPAPDPWPLSTASCISCSVTNVTTWVQSRAPLSTRHTRLSSPAISIFVKFSLFFCNGLPGMLQVDANFRPCCNVLSLPGKCEGRSFPR